MTDVVWQTESEGAQAGDTVLAAKLHVLGLAPIKNKLGPRWERLSDLVHKLFEKAIARAQGPSDHFVVLNELSYAVTFANLSRAQTNLVCTSIATDVCDHLFGDQIDEISVRSIVAEIVSPSDSPGGLAGSQIEATLERSLGLLRLRTHPNLQMRPRSSICVGGLQIHADE